MEHPTANRPSYREDERIRETIRKEMKAYRPGPGSEEERERAIASLSPVLRPRPVLGALRRDLLLERSPPTSPESQSPGAWGRVRLAGLCDRKDLNGSAGFVVDAAPNAAGRIVVKLASPLGKHSGKVVRVRPDRLADDAAARSPTRADRTDGLQRSRSATDASLRASIGNTVRLLPLPPTQQGYNRMPHGGFYDAARVVS